MDDATYIRGLTLINPTDTIQREHNRRLNEIADRLARLDTKPDADLTEIRSAKSNRSQDASPCGILQRALDLIRDDKWNPDVLIITGGTNDDGDSNQRYFVASPSILATVGLFELTKFDLCKDGSE